MRTSETGLFPALEAAFKAASGPMDCHQLYELPSVRDSAASANRVSDYLGNMWRKGLLTRLPAPREGNSRSRWIYEWKGHKGPSLYGHDYTPKVLADRPTLLITEDGQDMTLETEHLIIIIRQKFKPPQ